MNVTAYVYVEGKLGPMCFPCAVVEVCRDIINGNFDPELYDLELEEGDTGDGQDMRSIPKCGKCGKHFKSFCIA